MERKREEGSPTDATCIQIFSMLSIANGDNVNFDDCMNKRKDNNGINRTNRTT